MKIYLVLVGFFVVTTLAQVKSGIKEQRYHRRANDNHITVNSDDTDNRAERPHEDDSTIRNIRHRHHGFRHNPEWHQRHGIPLSNERTDEERRHRFTHNIEWHRMHGIPMPVERKHGIHHNDDRHRQTNFSTTTTKRTTTPTYRTTTPTYRTTTPTYRTTTPTSRTTTPTKGTNTTPEPQYSREM